MRKIHNLGGQSTIFDGADDYLYHIFDGNILRQNRWNREIDNLVFGVADGTMQVSADGSKILFTQHVVIDGVSQKGYHLLDTSTGQTSFLFSERQGDTIARGVTMSKSGTTIVMFTSDERYDPREAVRIYDIASGETREIALEGLDEYGGGLNLSLEGERVGFLVRHYYEDPAEPGWYLWRVKLHSYDAATGAPLSETVIADEAGEGVELDGVFDRSAAGGMVRIIDHFKREDGSLVRDGSTYQNLLTGRSFRIVDGPEDMSRTMLSQDGRFVIFTSLMRADAADPERSINVFVFDGETGETRVVDRLPVDQAADLTSFVGLSADHRTIFFRTTKRASPSDTDGDWDMFAVANPFDPAPTDYPSEYRDVLRGFDEDEYWRLDAGDDEARMQGGDDRIYGEAGDDRIWGEEGNDTLVGGIGNDLLDGGDGDDVLWGDQETDEYADDGHDRLIGGAGNDRLYGGGGDDIIEGGTGDDRIDGGSGDDVLKGGAGDDTISGGLGSDRIFMDAGEDVIDGGDGQDEEGDGQDRDVLVFEGSAGDYWFDEFITADPKDSFTRIDGATTGTDIVRGIEVASFDHLRDNVATVDNVFVTLAEAALVAYDNALRMGEGWVPLTAMELGVRMAGMLEDGDTRYTFANGLYSAKEDFWWGELEAVAHVSFGVVDGRNTLLVAFRGTDTVETDGTDYPEMALHYARFAPLVDAIIDYVNDGGHSAHDTIDQVYVSGHSLGGGVAQMFMQDARVFGDARYLAATFGSPLAEQYAYDPRMIHFEHSGDPIPLVGDLARTINSVPVLPSTRLLALANFFGVEPSAMGFRPSGGVVRIVTDDAVGPGMKQHAMTGYLASVERMAARPEDYPFMLEGTLALDGGRAHVVIGTEGIDHLTGSDPTIIQLLRGSDYFDGDETIIGGLGADTMTGGVGRDTFKGSAAELDLDQINDFAAGDLIRIDGVDLTTADIAYDWLGGAGRLTAGATRIFLAGRHDGAFTIVRTGGGFTEIGYVGGRAATGGDDADRMAGGDHADELAGGGGNDILHGADGDDLLAGGAGDDFLIGGAGEDRLIGDEPGTGLRSGGPAGRDLLDGGAGSDVMTGGGGADWFVLGADAPDRVTDLSRTDGDILDVTALLQDIGWTGGRGDPFLTGHFALVANGTGTILRVDRDGAAGPEAARDAAYLDGIAPEAFVGSLFYGGGIAIDPRWAGARKEGTAGANVITGGRGGDVIQGLAGRDVLRGGDGHDVLDGGDDDDMLWGEAGDDLLIGGAGNDTLDGGAGDDMLQGGPGGNILRGGAGDDILVGSAGTNDSWYGGAGNDRFVIAPAREQHVVIRDFQRGDRLDVSLLGISDAEDALGYFWQSGRDAVFSDREGMEIRLANWSVADLRPQDILVGSGPMPGVDPYADLPFPGDDAGAAAAFTVVPGAIDAAPGEIMTMQAGRFSGSVFEVDLHLAIA